jgi:tRNA pseudouridine55 synthase
MDGLLVVDKPAGPTSHDVVARVRTVLRERRVGHTGTLDPGASGVLPLVVGRATRLAQFISADSKTYETTLRLGQATDSGDRDGQPIGPASVGPFPNQDAIDRALEPFRGTFFQQPPAFSAKKIDGTRSYRLARRLRASGLTGPSEAPALPAPVAVTTRSIEVLNVRGADVTLRIDCSSGFYVRSLVHDLGVSLELGAHVTSIRRLRCGHWTLDQAISLDKLGGDTGRETALRALLPLAGILPALGAAVLTDEGARHAAHGRDLAATDFVEGLAAIPSEVDAIVQLLDPAGQLVGIAKRSGSSAALHPSVILV